MSEETSFESLMRAAPSGPGTRRLRVGDVVTVPVLQVASDWVFVDAGTPSDGRIARAELDARGTPIAVGDLVQATVVDPKPDGPVLAVQFGHGASGSDGTLELMLSSGTPVEAEVTRAVKGGVEVSIGSVRAFCPASQLELGRVADLTAYVGRRIEFRVIEVRDGGRSVVVSRRALLEDQRRAAAATAKERLVVGSDVEGVVQALSKHGAVVDLGGVEGFIHLSELAPHRIERAEDVVTAGETVRARVLSVEDSPKGLRVRLSLRALAAPTEKANEKAPPVDEVLKATVTRATPHGLLVQTARGQGLIPARELGLAPGADHRRAFPAGKELNVVIVSRAGNKLTFSATEVARVEERTHYREFSGSGAAGAQPSFGSLGDILRERFPNAAPAAEPAPVPPAAAAPARAAAAPPPSAARKPEAAAAIPQASDAAPAPAQPPQRNAPGAPHTALPPGVRRR
jgi:small subunit ribosomal protein S1